MRHTIKMVSPSLLIGAMLLFAACKGDTGAVRPAGAQGPPSVTGAQGPEGPQGVKGGTGPQEPEGPRCNGGQTDRGGEESGTELAVDETFDEVRACVRLVMKYDAATRTFIGTVTNTTEGPLTSVRVEVHLSNGTELGPTTPIDLAAGESAIVTLPAGDEPFDGWTPHAEVGAGGEGGGEHGPGGESGSG